MLNNKNVFITGTNRGIGKAILIKFAKSGANIFAHARCETPEFLNLINQVENEYKVKVSPIYFDMTDIDQMKEEIKNFLKTKIQLDVLVNNAGVSHGGLFQMTPIKKIKEVFELNLFSNMELTQLLLRAMTKSNAGSIINISSIVGIDLHEGYSAYGVSKAALIAWTKVLSKELARYNIRVNAVAPGLIDTNMAKLIDNKAGAEMLQSSAMKRLGTPEEIANIVEFIASDKASFLNGQVVRVDGGQV